MRIVEAIGIIWNYFQWRQVVLLTLTLCSDWMPFQWLNLAWNPRKSRLVNWVKKHVGQSHHPSVSSRVVKEEASKSTITTRFGHFTLLPRGNIRYTRSRVKSIWLTDVARRQKAEGEHSVKHFQSSRLTDSFNQLVSKHLFRDISVY
jgi:hypothetical protein